MTANPSMASATQLFKAGRLDEAIQALGAELRDNPADAQRRTFLFELLCFAGSYDRAEKQLGVLAQEGKEAALGGLLYQAALAAERTRQEMFEAGRFPQSAAASVVSGTLNGKPFRSLSDADPRIGARLEVFAGGQYMWLPFEHIASVKMQPPKRLRDLLWAPAIVRTGPSFRGVELGEVLVPVLAPQSWQFDDDGVRLGRTTEWVAGENDLAIPVGQKLLLVDEEEVPLLEVRELEISPATAAPGGSPVS